MAVPDPLGTRDVITLEAGFVRDEVARFLAEDVGAGDVTSALTVPAGTRASARLVARATCVVAGLEVAREVFRQLDGTVAFRPLVREGDRVEAGTGLAGIDGPAAAILTGER
ncbi:MAG: hypothetical protein Q7V01_11250, partial [Vicinamibacterales bacterium]|nr:hypothetical protein [Vicinamibacterales bacterium]